MEEKREIKVSLGTVICIVIILILVVVLGIVYYLGFVDNSKKVEKVAEEKEELQEEINTLNEEIEELNNKIAILNNAENANNKNDFNEQNNVDKNLDSSKESINKLGMTGTSFVINDIVKNGDKYTISAYILEEEARKISEQEYKNILNGQEITFRNIKWKYDKDDSNSDVVYLKAIGNYNNMSYAPMIALIYNTSEKIGYFSNTAGVKAELCDYSEEIKFDVSSDIKVCAFWGEFKYINGELTYRNIDDIEIEPESIEYLIDFCNNNEPGTCGTYEECIAFVSNGKVDAIKIFDK